MSQLETVILANGCFWCTEAIFNRLIGVTSVIPGYAASQVASSSCKEVCTGRTGAAEATQITYGPSIISYDTLLEIFWHAHDPTTLNRQGNDIGTQYRSAIFYHDDAQKKAAEKSKQEAQKDFPKPIVTEIIPFTKFFVAENYHQNYFRLHQNQPYCSV